MNEKEKELLHKNNLLETMRSIHQLIIRENDPRRLLSQICRFLVDKQGYYKAWIVLMADGTPVEPYFHAGFEDDFSPMRQILSSGTLPSCGAEVMSSGEMRVISKSVHHCSLCPYKDKTTERTCLSLRLEKDKTVFGWMTLSCPPEFLVYKEDYSVLQDLAGDIGYALWAMDNRSQLEEGERRLKTLMGNLPGMAYRCRNTILWPMEFVSEGCLKLTGYRSEELTGPGAAAYGTLIDIDDRQKVWDQVQAALKEDRPYLMEYRIKDKAGRERWIWEQGRAVETDRDGTVIVEGFMSDMTDIKNVELERETLLVNLQERTKELSCLFRVSDTLRNKEEPLSVLDDVVRLIPPGWQYPALTCCRIRIDGREYLSEGFEESPWALHSQINVNGNAVGSLDIYYRRECPPADIGPFLKEEKDLTDGLARILSESLELGQADQERLMLAHAIEQAEETILVTDREGTIQYVNPAFEKNTGYSRREALGQNPRILKSGEQDETFYQDLWTQIRGGETWRGRFINKKKDGSVYTEDAVISPVFDNTGTIVNYVGVKHNISHELILEAQLRQAQKMEAVGRLAGGIAHDFNNMLGVILGHTELLLETLNAAPPLMESLAEIQNAGLRSSDLTRQLLSFARKQTIAPRVIELNETVSSMFSMLRRLIGEDITLNWMPGDELWPVKIDPGQVDQILANLCVNARDSIDKAGIISIETENVKFDREYSPVHGIVPPGHYVMLAVSDNGCGMSEEILDNVFEPFFTTKGMGDGTGLGLAMVYGAVKQNEGYIIVDSEPGVGSSFKVFLPRTEPEQRDAGNEPEALPSMRGNETILVVEDEETILLIVRKMLSAEGYQVLSASNPLAAMEIAKKYESTIDLLITDVVMPDMNGRDLTASIQNILPDLKHLYMSGYTADVIAHHGILEDGVRFVKKPFSRNELLGQVRAVLDED